MILDAVIGSCDNDRDTFLGFFERFGTTYCRVLCACCRELVPTRRTIGSVLSQNRGDYDI